MNEIDADEFMRIAEQTPALANAIKFNMSSNYDNQLQHLWCVLDELYCNLVEARKYYSGMNEDEITIALVQQLQNLGLDAAHDRDTSGHSDISVIGNKRFVWICEAKISNGYGWLMEGYNQLLTRYSTGLAQQKTGEFLIYCNKKKPPEIMQRWFAHLAGKDPEIKKQFPDANDSSVFFSIKQHDVSGLDYTVRHKILGLYYQPI